MKKYASIPVSLSWSGGKDSAFALWKLNQSPEYQVVRLHTTFGQETRRVGLHGIHESLIEAQALAVGLPLDKLYYPASADNQAYEKAINAYLNTLASQDIRHLAYGDIFLEDLRQYREKQSAAKNMETLFPLWGIDTQKLAQEFIQNGFRTLICAADSEKIQKKWMGKAFDPDFLAGLPPDLDPCGENGEFHTFCVDGPIFSQSVAVKMKEIISKSYSFTLANGEEKKQEYWFADLHLSAD
ncbi:adenine nucleotide alpha hydrolase [Pararhodonellum marinum]|uniref:adenine nucleotide alpha hydrolase n=1 Tax=Pararhodonellum marinum TaxID=2755358 RepID=UPI00188E7649|nr:adenine nucleotide alpha hydrolase [Pararhodonellum marinum]